MKDVREPGCREQDGAAIAPWSARVATDKIRAYAVRRDLDLNYKKHAKERLAERDLTISDALYVLKYGFVYGDPEPATQPGFFKYSMEGSTPNTGGRSLRVVVIPSPCRAELKVVTVMWIDER